MSADGARHNLIYGICATLVDYPDVYRVAQFVDG